MVERNYSMYDEKWWEAESKHDNVFGLAKLLESNESSRRSSMLNYARMYSNLNMLGLDPHNYSNYTSNTSMHSTAYQDRIRLNVVTSVVDTLGSKISKNKPKVVLLPSGGDYSLQRRAERLEKFIAGIFDECNMYEISQKTFLYAAVFGTGIINIFGLNGNIEIDHVLPHELLIDTQEAIYGDPRQLLRRKHVDRNVLIERFPKFKTQISRAGQIEDDNLSIPNKSIADQATIVEAWHLPSGPDAKDGRHVVVVDNATLLDEEWEHESFPFVFLRWQNPLLGFWGRGIVEEIAGIQLEINKTLMRIQQAHHMLSNPLIFVNMASAISKAHINNNIGTFVPYTGEKPEVKTFQSVHPEIYEHLDRLYARAFEIVGVSQQSSQSKNQLGPDASGAAIREMSDLESERFSIMSQEYERFFVKTAEKIIRTAKEIYSNDEELETTVRGKNFIKKIKWKDVAMEDDQFSLDVGTASMLPETKAGKIQMSTELFQAGVISQEEWKDLLQMPDLDESTDLERAPRSYIKDVVEKILDEGIVIEIEKYDNLQYAIKYAIMTYQKSKLNNVPEDRLELLRRYIESIDLMLSPPEQPPEAGPPAAALPPGAAPAAPGAGAPPGLPGAPPQIPSGVPPQG